MREALAEHWQGSCYLRNHNSTHLFPHTDRPFSVDVVRQFGRQLLEAVACAHSRCLRPAASASSSSIVALPRRPSQFRRTQPTPDLAPLRPAAPPPPQSSTASASSTRTSSPRTSSS